MFKQPQRVKLGKPVKKANCLSSGKQFQQNSMKKMGNISETERQAYIFMAIMIRPTEVKNVSGGPKIEL